MIPLWLHRLFLHSSSARPTESAIQPHVLVEAGSLCVATTLQIIIAVISKIAELELVFGIIVMHKSASIAGIRIARPAVSNTAIGVLIRVCAASGLHAASSGETRDGVRWRAISESRAECLGAVGVFAGQVEEVYTRKYNKETTKERDCVDCRRGVEALEQETRCNESASRKSYVVEGVHAELQC